MSESKKIALVIIGGEILSGRTLDKNTQWIAERLTEHGAILTEVRIVLDSNEVIIKAVQELSAANDYVFTTGGIGPTHDDITAQSVADAFNARLETNAEAFAVLQAYYDEGEFTPARQKMAMIPAGASLIPNPVTAAPGFLIENVFVMAGVPRIMQAMFDHVLEHIEAGQPILSRTVTCQLQESQIAPDLGALQETYPDIEIGSYPNYRNKEFGLSLVLRGTDASLLDNVLEKLTAIIDQLGGQPNVLTY